MDATGRPFALVMRKGQVAPHALSSPPPERAGDWCMPQREASNAALPSRSEVLAALQDACPLQGSVLIATTGYTGRELYALADQPNQLYVVGSMGCASSLGLGLALVRPDLQVVVADGDGAALMRLGNFATVGAYAGDNFAHVLLDNGQHESTGGQSTVSHVVDFAALAAACGYRQAHNCVHPVRLEPGSGRWPGACPHPHPPRGSRGLAAAVHHPAAGAQPLMQHIGAVALWREGPYAG